MSKFLSKDAGFTEIIVIINEMIEESVYHTKTFAHALEAHHNRKAANVFLHVADQFIHELQIVSKYSSDVQLSKNPPWELPHADYMHPSLLLMDAHYLMDEEEAWKIMDGMIKIHQDFYTYLSEESKVESVISLMLQLIDHCDKCRKK